MIMDHQIEEITCPVCMSTFRRPATLPCGHTFCFPCLLNSTKQNRNCPICRQHFPSAPNKLKPDHTLSTFLQSLRKTQLKFDKQQPQNIHVQCKEQRLLLIDITTDDLLLPYNKIAATFELQNNVLVDRMDRFVARQQQPFNRYAVVCRLVHVKEVRKNLYEGTIQGKAFCKLQEQNIESQVSLEGDEEDFYYRTCLCKEISESSNSSPSEYALFFTHFQKITDHNLKTQIYHRIDPSIFSTKTDVIALFYSILGIINLQSSDKYELATSFDQSRRISQINNFLTLNSKRIAQNPLYIIKLKSQQSLQIKFFYGIVLIVSILLMVNAYGEL